MRRRQRRRCGLSDSKCAARSIRFTYIEICMPSQVGEGGGVDWRERGSIVECGGRTKRCARRGMQYFKQSHVFQFTRAFDRRQTSLSGDGEGSTQLLLLPHSLLHLLTLPLPSPNSLSPPLTPAFSSLSPLCIQPCPANCLICWRRNKKKNGRKKIKHTNWFAYCRGVRAWHKGAALDSLGNARSCWAV